MAYSSVFLIASVLVTFSFQVDALHVGLNLSKHECSRKCESQACDVPGPSLRYGKYCGVSYSGCPGEAPCDDLDDCCMRHDHCIDEHGNDYLNVGCNRELQRCVRAYKRSGAPAFKGNTCDVNKAVNSIDTVMQAAIVLGTTLGH